ncbi:MAG: hypothetical protein JXQ29_06470 [Planctomycetes bacterium]|nr:hypothetical protein [Planctomycetota bacterium]
MGTFYWIARFGLVALWLGVACAAWRRARGTSRGQWRIVAGLAVLFAAARATRWNWELLAVARELLRRAGVYDQRIWLKGVLLLGLAAVLLTIGVWLVRAVRAEGTAFGIAMVAGAAMSAVIAAGTFSLDDLLPGVLCRQPGRYLLEYGLGGACLVATHLRARSRPS